MSGVGSGWDVDDGSALSAAECVAPSPFKACTSKSSHWCRNCGTCTCVRLGPTGTRTWSDEIDPQCSLHRAGSRHPYTQRRARIVRA